MKTFLAIADWDNKVGVETVRAKTYGKWSADVYQILTWILRQHLLDRGFRIGLERPEPEIRLANFPTVSDYVKAIAQDIRRREDESRLRFKNLRLFYRELLRETDPEERWASIQHFHVNDLDGEDGLRLNDIDEIEPVNNLRFGFERLFYVDEDKVSRLYMDWLLGGAVPISEADLNMLREVVPGVGRHLQRKSDGSLEIDFNYSEFVRQFIAASEVIYKPVFGVNSRFNPILSQLLGYLFRSDRSVNPSEGWLQSILSPKKIRGRHAGHGKMLDQTEDELQRLGLLTAAVHSHLKRNMDTFAPKITQYMP